MENSGWIKLHNKFLQWEWMDNPNMVALFIHFLLNANYQEKNWHGQIIKPGELIIGRKALSKKTGISQQAIRTCLTRLKSTNEITIKSTNRYSIISLTNWHKYQQKQPAKQPASQPTSNQQATTPIEYKEVKNRMLAGKPAPAMGSKQVAEIIDLFKEVNPNHSRLFRNTTQRAATERLIKKYGFENVAKGVRSLPGIINQKYAPKITTPYDLERDMGKLAAFINQEKQTKPNKVAFL